MKKLNYLFIVSLFATIALSQPQAPDILWTRTFDYQNYDCGECVRQTSDGGYILLGNSKPLYSSPEDLKLIKTDGTGNLLWDRTFGGIYSDYGYNVRQTLDGGYIIAGETSGDCYIIKTDSLGNEQWFKTMWSNSGPDESKCIQQTSDGGYIIAGTGCNNSVNVFDIKLIRLESELAVEDNTFDLLPFIFNLECYPNPFNSSLDIRFEMRDASEVELKVFDISGREVAALGTGHWALGEDKVTWNAEGITSGIYFVRLSVIGSQFSDNSGQTLVKKVVLIK